jgi:hypothetical protein
VATSRPMTQVSWPRVCQSLSTEYKPRSELRTSSRIMFRGQGSLPTLCSLSVWIFSKLSPARILRGFLLERPAGNYL